MVIFKKIKDTINLLTQEVNSLKETISNLEKKVAKQDKDIQRLKGLDISIQKQTNKAISQDEIFNEWFNGKEDKSGDE